MQREEEMKMNHLLSSQALPPCLEMPQFDIRQTISGMESGSGTHPSTFLLQQQTPGEISSFSAKTSSSAPEHNSHCQITTMKGGGQRGCTHHVWTTHTCIYTFIQTLQNTHTHTLIQETYLFKTGQMFYLSLRVSECSAPSDEGVLISGAGSSVRHGCSDKSHLADQRGTHLHVI